MLIFRAMSKNRLLRKQSGNVAEAEAVRQAEERDESKLKRYRAQKQKEREEQEAAILARINEKKEEIRTAEAKAAIRLVPGSTPKKVDKIVAQQKAREEATKAAMELSKANEKPAEGAKKVPTVKPVKKAEKAEEK